MRGSKPHRETCHEFLHLMQALIALPALSLFRKLPDAAPDAIVEVNGWILKRGDLT